MATIFVENYLKRCEKNLATNFFKHYHYSVTISLKATDNFQLTSNLDPMHLVKRYRGQVITPKRDIILIKRSINRSHVETYLPELKPLLNIHDYQNVPYAVKLLTGLSNIKLKPIPKDTLDHQIYNELICLSEVVTPLLNIFVDPKISLIYQLEQLSYCAHLLFYIFRKWKTSFITKDLYMVNLVT